jgi:Domain of Unknown Function (DUF928)
MKVNQKKPRFNQILNYKLVVASSLVLFGCTQVQAQPLNPSPNQPDAPLPSVIFVAPPLPPGTGAPTGRRSGAGSRGCRNTNEEAAAIEKHVTALVPSIPSNESPGAEFVGGLTAAERPTFWFYVTYQPPFTGKFILQDKDENLVYETDVILPTNPGVIQISLPSNVPPLEIGKLYNWYFKIRCNPNSPTLSFVHGWIQRTSLNPALSSQLQNATPQQKVALYARNGIWYEALTIAAELKRNNSNDRNWSDLLEAVGLSEIKAEAIVEK